ncbi:hypothetical protein PHYBOEH_009743 [Phytophthora boehmeriae]|uniref:Uncharacterized protein n=1 Tax=Phytophthora boehmeriae TaxID=109152 RepID=A0A8T1VV18_9STRA|nr:hypothetical protein PHYBOEH_009743 [Phytophthora boehmeriae]
MEKNEDSIDQGQTIPHQEVFDSIDTHEMPIVDTGAAPHESIAPLDGLPPVIQNQKSSTPPLTARQSCWEEQVPPIAVVVPEGSLSLNGSVPDATISSTRPDKIENDLADAVQESEKNVDPCESHTNVIYSAEMQDPGVEILLAESRKPGEGEDVSEAEVPDESNGSNQPQEPATEKNSVDSVDSVLNVGNEEVIEKGYLVPVDPIHCVGNVGMIKNGSNMVGQSLCDPNSEQTHFQIDDAPQQSQISEEDPSPDEMAVDNSTESQPTTIGEGLVDVIQLEATDVLMDSILSNQLAATAIENDVNPAADTAGITSPTFIDSNDNPPLTDNITVQVLENATCQAIEITSASPDDNDHALAHEYPSENDKMTPRVGDDIEGDENIDTPTNEDESMNLNRLRGSIGKSPSNAKTILEDNESSTTQDFPEEPISLPLVKAASPHAHKQKGMDGSNGQPEKKADGLADLKVARHKRSVSKERESVPGEIIDGKVHSEALKPMDSSSSPNNKGTKKKLTKDKLNAIEPQILAQHKRKDSSPPAVKEIAPTVTIPVQLDEPLIESPKNEKASGVSRRKSQSSSNNVVLPSSTGQVKSPVKGSISRKRSVVQLTEAQTIGPIPELKQQPVEDVNIASHRRSVRRVSSVRKSDVLPGPSSPTNAEKVPGEAKPAQSKLLPAKRQSSRLVGASPKVSNYHKKWGKWLAGRKIIEKASCLQLEERVLQDPRDGENLLKLGLRYAQWHGTSLPGILLLEHATLLHKNTIGSHEYWFWLGSAHLDMFMRHRKYLPIARFHLGKCIRAFTSAFAYMEALVDPMLLLRYAIGLFWHKGDGNLEKTCEIFHELFSRFVIFCDKDRPNLLFLQFQVLHRLKLYVDAIECMNKILEIHENPQHSAVSNGMSRLSSEPVAQVSVYDTMDYLLMLMQCQKATGDSVSAAQTLSSVLKLKNAPQDNTLKDDEHFELWCTLAEKCFHHEDYALAVEYYALALNFAKQSEELATIHYNLGLCFQALGEDSKCVTEYKRARTSNRHVTPLVSLAELAASYEEQFALLRQKSVAQTVEEVRVDLYGRAVKRLQRIFRRNRKDLHNNANDTSSESSVTKMPTLSKRRSTVGNPPALVKIEDVAEGTEAEDTFQQNGDGVNDNQISKCDDSALEVIERRHESFLARKQAAMEEMAALLTNPQYRYQVAPHALDSNVRPKVGIQVRSGMLSPEKDRLDMRRNQSLEAFRQLGYVSSTMPWIEFWEKLLPLASELFESRQTLYGSIARIRGRLPLVTDEIAFCALAESIGNVHQAAEKLHDSLYERELTYVCAVIDVSKQLMRDFPSEPTQVTKPVRVSLPTILSPTAESHSPVGSMSPNRVLLPPYSPARASPSKTQTPTKHLRMNQMVNLQFQEHVQQQEAAMAIADATGKPRQQTEKLLVLQGFRQANSALLSSQVSFGSEKAAT